MRNFTFSLLTLLLLTLSELQSQAQPPESHYTLKVDGEMYEIEDVEAKYRALSDGADNEWVLDIALKGKQPKEFYGQIYATFSDHGEDGIIHCVCRGQEGYEDGKVYGKVKIDTDLDGSAGYAQFNTQLSTRRCGKAMTTPETNALELEQLKSVMVRNPSGVELERHLYNLSGKLLLYDRKKQKWVPVKLDFRNVVI